MASSHGSDVLVLGAGIVGLTLALKLQERGRSVLLLDRGQAGGGTSFGNAGLIERSSVFPYAFPRDWRTLLDYARQRLPHAHYHVNALLPLLPWLARYWFHSAPRRYHNAIAGALPLIEHSWSEHAKLIEAAGASDLVVGHGWIKVYRRDASALMTIGQAEQSRAYGLQVEILSRDAARALEPALADDILGGVRYADSRQIRDPFALSQRYLLLFQQRGGKLVRGDAQSLQAERDQWRLDSDEGTCVAPQAVLALGPQGGDLARRLGYRLPLGQKRGYHMHYAAPSVPLRHTIVDVDNGYALAPMARGIRLTTGAEFALRDAPATPVQLEMVEPIARRLVSIGARLDAQPWLGSRPCTADMLPLLGPAPRHRGLWFSFGHAHHGLTQAASSGRLMAELMCGEAPYIDPTPYRVDRF